MTMTLNNLEGLNSHFTLSFHFYEEPFKNSFLHAYRSYRYVKLVYIT